MLREPQLQTKREFTGLLIKHLGPEVEAPQGMASFGGHTWDLQPAHLLQSPLGKVCSHPTSDSHGSHRIFSSVR